MEPFNQDQAGGKDLKSELMQNLSEEFDSLIQKSSSVSTEQRAKLSKLIERGTLSSNEILRILRPEGESNE